ncbi:hypothetical protein ABIQ69_15310 [Agromyces sp. G08B096]|uniref:Uncharacterized protein n=1 Tax=Agromyces sp. G08B096 TaxID=3156399 RepID=A0AAU7W5M4_9MICO
MPNLDLIAVLVELLAWVGLGLGLPVLIAAVIARAADRRERVDVVVVQPADGHGPALVRWFADGELHERPIAPDELHGIADHESAEGYARPGGRLSFERRGHAARVLAVLAWVLLSVGIAALAASVVLMLVAG